MFCSLVAASQHLPRTRLNQFTSPITHRPLLNAPMTHHSFSSLLPLASPQLLNSTPRHHEPPHPRSIIVFLFFCFPNCLTVVCNFISLLLLESGVTLTLNVCFFAFLFLLYKLCKNRRSVSNMRVISLLSLSLCFVHSCSSTAFGS